MHDEWRPEETQHGPTTTVSPQRHPLRRPPPPFPACLGPMDQDRLPSGLASSQVSAAPRTPEPSAHTFPLTAALSPLQFLVCLLVNTHQVSASPAEKRKEQWQARAREGDVSAPSRKFRAKTPSALSRPGNKAVGKNRPGLPIQSLLGSKGRFLLYPPSMILHLLTLASLVGWSCRGQRQHTGPAVPARCC